MVKTGMVFGVFDGLHEGHKYFLKEAAKQAEKLVVVVARPENVRGLKNREAKNGLEERMAAIRVAAQEFDSKITVVQGDTNLGEWSVLKAHKPDVVFLGYDQQTLAEELRKIGMKFEFIDPYFPERFKSSLM